jgi:hypothetical protein
MHDKKNAIMLTESFLKNTRKNLEIGEGCNFTVRYAEFLIDYSMNVIWNIEEDVYNGRFKEIGDRLPGYLRYIYNNTPSYAEIATDAKTIMDLIDSYNIFAQDNRLYELADNAYQALNSMDFEDYDTYNIDEFKDSLRYLMPLMSYLKNKYAPALNKLTGSNGKNAINDLYIKMEGYLRGACDEADIEVSDEGFFAPYE